MRGYGAPASPDEAVTDALVYPDWGWGDPTPSAWTQNSVDWGWGSAHEPIAPSYLELETRRVGDDGGYELRINGYFPRFGASTRQRPTGFRVYLVDAQNNEHPAYSGRAGQGEVCSTDYNARILTAYTPPLPVGAYTVIVRVDGADEEAGTLSVERRTRTEEEYALRSALSTVMDTGARAIEYDPLLTATAPDANEETHSNLATLLRIWGQALAQFKGTGIVTRLTEDFAVGDTVLYVESTLGMPSAGAVRIRGTHLRYEGSTPTSLLGISRINGQTRTLTQGVQVTHDPYVIAD